MIKFEMIDLRIRILILVAINAVVTSNFWFALMPLAYDFMREAQNLALDKIWLPIFLKPGIFIVSAPLIFFIPIAILLFGFLWPFIFTVGFNDTKKSKEN